ncbi:hypothetical protein [Chryseobacterium sp.]|uniref:hypothetical protein n=1 Tax=Chryseobacterium sp. TaxID=1871047 RepID=UPI001B2840C3|nr:hypothetical protein [Chryseobacterium sp.]MBO9693600.1 hypothetical protein [Chryseobacterium sp.]
MKNSRTTLNILCSILSVFILSCFLSCKGDHAQNYRNRTNIPEFRERIGNTSRIFLTYLDSLVHFPDTKFNEPTIRSFNDRYASQLPLVMYDSLKTQSNSSILIQYYKSKQLNLQVESGIRFLIPKTIADSLVVSDFTNHFGPVTNEKTLIGITKYPLPVHIRTSRDREIKLTFKNDVNRERAGVIMVEILNYK